MLEELTSFGLVKKAISDEGDTRYTMSVRGLDFLETYWKMNAFLETFEEGTQTRELVAIMFTDIAGFTELAQRNERDALRLLQEHEKMVRDVLSRFNGREVKTIGDAFLIEFTSALKACECAIELRRTLSRKNDGPYESRVATVRLKIGIHIGDVERRGTDIVGDAVNIASRIQSAAKPNEILISRQVFDQVWNKLGSHMTELGYLEAKNLQLPLQLFRIDEFSDNH